MNILKLITLIQEMSALVAQLESDGTLAKLQAADTAIQTEIASNETLKALIAKVESMFVPAPKPSEPVAPTV